MSLDIVIRGGTIIDGTGKPGYIADLGIKADKIVAIGSVTEQADREIDATGKIVAPGFVDPHTHYDAQLSWDQQVTPSCWHGVTTTVIGNCGVGIAPVSPTGPPTGGYRPGQCGGNSGKRAQCGY